MKRLFTLVPLLLICSLLYAGGSPEAEAPAEVVATTSWTAAFAEVAGITEIRVLAPYELQHPPEYELTPGDIKAIGEAKMIIYAGYEVMLERLKESTATEAAMVQIETVNVWPVITKSVEKIAAVAGTEATAAANLAEIEALFAAWRTELAPYRDIPVVTHTFLQGMVKSLGLTVVGTFGPAPLEAKQLKELTATDAELIIDNWHTDVGSPLRETMPEAGVAEFINFPGKDGTRSLIEVLEYNREALRTALE